MQKTKPVRKRQSIYYPGSPFKVKNRYAKIDFDEVGGWGVFEVEELASTTHQTTEIIENHELNIIVTHPLYSTNLPMIRNSAPPASVYRHKSKYLSPATYKKMAYLKAMKQYQINSNQEDHISIQQLESVFAATGKSGLSWPSPSIELYASQG
jgi:hypothetical protein